MKIKLTSTLSSVAALAVFQNVASFESPAIASNLKSISRGGILGLNRFRGRNDVQPSVPPLAMDNSSTAPPSQMESILANAKTLNPFNKQKSGEESQGVIVPSLAAGLAVSLAMIPEAVSFAYVAGVSPLVGLWTTVFMGFVAASFGGRAGICSSASGACSVVVAALCRTHGAAYLSACAILAGFLQVLFGGVFGLGKFIRLVPHPVMLGFVNGLTVVMLKAQMTHFKDAAGAFLTLSSSEGKVMYGLTALTVLMVKIIPKFKKLSMIPPSLGAVTVCSLIAKAFNMSAKTLADVSGADTFRGGLSVLPSIAIPKVPLSLETLKIITPFAITMAAVGAIESLLTMQLLDGIADDGSRGSTKKECLGQGLGNIASGFAGGIGGCALLGQSIINVQSGGGISRLSGMSMALFLAVGIVAAAPLLASVPIAALVGVMLVVCQSTFSWSSLRILHKIPKLDAATIFLVSIITVKDDLAKAVVAGVIASSLGFAWKQSTSITASQKTVPRPFSDEDAAELQSKETEWKSYEIQGPLFFGSVTQFGNLFNVKEDPKDVVLDFTKSRVMDHSALEAINTVADRYGEAGKRVHLRHLSSDCASLLKKLNDGQLPPYELIESDPATDPVYGVADAAMP